MASRRSETAKKIDFRKLKTLSSTAFALVEKNAGKITNALLNGTSQGATLSMRLLLEMAEAGVDIKLNDDGVTFSLAEEMAKEPQAPAEMADEEAMAEEQAEAEALDRADAEAQAAAEAKAAAEARARQAKASGPIDGRDPFDPGRLEASADTVCVAAAARARPRAHPPCEGKHAKRHPAAQLPSAASPP